jgi:hypothetical protein
MEGYKIACSLLSPVREFSTTDYEQGFWVEKGHIYARSDVGEPSRFAVFLVLRRGKAGRFA